MSQAADIEDFASIPPPPAGASEHDSTPSLRSWTIPRLMAELRHRGISYPASAHKAELFRPFFPSTLGSSAEQVTLRTVALYYADAFHPKLSGKLISGVTIQGGDFGEPSESGPIGSCDFETMCIPQKHLVKLHE